MKQIVYVSSANSQQIEVWELNSDSSLNLIQVLKLNGEPQPIFIVKGKNCLYVGIRPKFCINSYQIEKSGTLIEMGFYNVPFSINHFEMDKTEKYLFSSSYHFNCINVTITNSLGIPQSSIQTIQGIKGCHASLMHYNNRNLFVSSLKTDRIYLYNFTPDGVLIENKNKFISLSNNSGPRHMIFQKNTNRLFNINELNGTISIWHVNKLCNSVIFLKNVDIVLNKLKSFAWSSDIHISPCKKYIYGSNRGNNTIAIVENNEHIKYIKVIGNIYTETQPRSFDIDQKGQHLIVVGERSNSMSVYSIDNITGLLKFKNRYPTGNRPVWISIHSIH
ncbi:beta-propeller fold lactonase family protein [Buchnera aphidicola]|uniref:6-phosphogluconolactonase n=1 Tax=Buchnera aphidicola subsp. Melaphis rhois TaxID=118103 RepID=A0A4D6YB44_BUCMH|nr:beta-propeller fold lactonase family protein [Buchnera aphidicola]QCI23298.1 6-phosphogluconolactonase [Buchnera aphidicola (Melaphis rhois)]